MYRLRLDHASMTPCRPSAASPARIKAADHQRLWDTIEGAVVDAFQMHPDYLTDKGRGAAVESVTKRCVGAIVGLIHETRKGGR